MLAASCTGMANADPVHPSRWVGQDTALYLEIPKPGAVLDRVTSESFQQALNGVPQYRRYLNSPGYKTARAVVDVVAGKLGTTWEKGLRDLTGAGVVLAADGAAGKAPRVTLFVTPADPAFLARATDTLLELARKDAADKGRPDPVQKTECRGITVYRVDKGAYATIRDSLVIGDSPDTLKAVIDRSLDGEKAGPALADDPRWKSEHDRLGPDAVAWSFVRADRLRALDPKKFALDTKSNPPLTFLFGSWLEDIRKADWASATLSWKAGRIAAELVVPTPKGGYAETLKGFVPPKGEGAAPLATPPGTIASVSLWRDLSAIWEARTELFTPEVVQGLAQLDGVAGQFFGGRDFGTGVLGSLANDWRLVVARQDFAAMNPVPDQKFPAFALIVDVKPDDDEFAQRLKVAFQTFIGLANVGAAQQKAPPLELGSETVDGVTIATSHFVPPKASSGEKTPVHMRQNFSPSAAQVDNHFILGSSTALVRDLVKSVRAPGTRNDSTLVAEADGQELAKLLELNRKRMVMQNMLDKGHDKAKAEEEVGTLFDLLRYLGHARLAVQDGNDAVRLKLDFALSDK
jgi:hypothetical protein